MTENQPEHSRALTPMMRQYLYHKQRHPDAILLFRMGDFYEMFLEDARKASRILEIALTTRDKNKEESVPMCGFPHHAASGYISRLLAAGERVAVCDQMEDPRTAKGIVKREVTRVLTPGLTEDPGTLKADENHYIVALTAKGEKLALAAFDLSTGDLQVTGTTQLSLAEQELRRLAPKEVLIPEHMPEDHRVRVGLDGSFYVHQVEEWISDPRACSDALKEIYGVRNLEGFGLTDKSVRTLAAGTVMGYVRQTRPDAPTHIKPLRVYHLGDYMVLDQSTLRNLEIFKNIREGTTEGTLIRLMDRTCTAMGARQLRHWTSYPLLDAEEIRRRLETVQALVDDTVTRGELRTILKEIGDLERIAGKISLKSANPRDLVQLRFSAEKIPAVLTLVAGLETEMSARILGMDDLSYVAHAIAAVLVDSPPAGLREGGVIREGYDSELDELRMMSRQGKEWIAGIEAGERERTGIPSLKVGYNKVFGYFIEVTRTHQDKVPAHYVRKQTLVNAERYITEDLKEYELKVLNAQETIAVMEEKIFDRLRTKLVEVIPRIQETASMVAALDVLVSLADLAVTRGYVRPQVNDDDEIRILGGRHPVVECFQHRESYVPNDVLMNRSDHQILIITGPNMAGKSTYMRQTALIVLMAQMGGFVPADSACIGIVDRIFTRIGAADYLAYGQSTFMVEMNETADILHNATRRSLVLLDEVGRGTSTFDGLSIAWAVTEYLHDKGDDGPRTLFATHYHELVDIARERDRVRNFNIAVRESKDDIVFLRKIVPGGASRSYGIQVAGLAGIPDAVIVRAREILSNLEKEEIDPSGIPRISKHKGKKKRRRDEPYQTELFGYPADELLKELEDTNPNSLTPLQALNVLAEWKTKYGGRS
ncbi:MAG: DNA mismatch repair protein MutS [Desulfomonilaceae bacterium]|nr:DNA mismatch repair protein MutS [Desulfomonilaceae bacterium]